MTNKETYTTEIETAIITPSSGKKLYIWQTLIKGEGELKFLTSDIQVSKCGASETRHSNILMEGAVDESLSLTCDNAEITILYDEI